MAKSEAAKRYAKALIIIATEANKIEAYSKELGSVVELFESNADLKKVFSSPVVKAGEKQALMEEIAKKSSLSDDVSKFLSLVAAKQRAGELEYIFEEYAKIEDGLSGKLRVTLEAPFTPGDDLKKSLTEQLAKETGKEIILTVEENKELIGGIKVRIGNTIIDASVTTQLNRMKDKILEGAL